MYRLQKSVIAEAFMISFSWLALSVTFGDTSPKGRGLGKKMKFAWTAKGSPFGGAAEQSEAERASLFAEKEQAQ